MSENHSANSPTRVIAEVLEQHDIALEHSSDAHEEVTAWQQAPGLDDPELIDWRDLPFVTIDNPGSRDLDQALLVEHDDHGYRVRYALADAAYYVAPGSALFREALQRGTTIYTPGFAAAMLPTALSEGLVSLNPEVDRRALVFDMRVDDEGNCQSTRVTQACIHSQAQLTYGIVQECLDAAAANADHALLKKPFSNSLLLLKSLGELLMQRALDRDVVPFDRHETEIRIEGTPARFVLRKRQRFTTEKYNEQISLLCNMQGAQLLTGFLESSSQLQAVFRVHDAPLAGRLHELRKTLHNLTEQFELPEIFSWREAQSLADYVTGLPEEARFQRLVQAIERQVLISNRASEFRAEPGRHHALGADSYARFSSPMREIVGIYTHKELLEVLGNSSAAPNGILGDIELRDQVVESANRARKVQKAIDKAIEFIVIDELLSQDLEMEPRPLRNATIVGVRSDRLYIAMDDYAVNLKVYRQDLEMQFNTQYTFDGIQAKASDPQATHFRLGDGVVVNTRGYDTSRRRYQLDLALIGDRPRF